MNTLNSGDTLGPFQILERIGQGGMATVYKALQPSLGRPVALKVLASTLAAQPSFSVRFRREAAALARLKHPNIVAIFDYGEQAGMAWLAMEYVMGETLAERAIRPMALADVISIVTQAAAALDHAHAHGVVHRDVKPSNILLEGDRVVLTDFGISLLAEYHVRLTSTGTGVGTPAYMSPEQSEGRVGDGRSDVYSLGVVTYELLAGRPPFAAPTPAALMHQILYSPVPPLGESRPELPATVIQAIERCLAKNPEDRFATAGAFAQALASGATLPALPIVAPSRQPEPSRPPYVGRSKLQAIRSVTLPIAGGVLFIGIAGLLVSVVGLPRLAMPTGSSDSGLAASGSARSGTTPLPGTTEGLEPNSQGDYYLDLPEQSRLIATPSSQTSSEAGGLATLTLRPHSDGVWTHWRVFDASGKKVAEGEPNSAIPVAKLPDGTYTVEWTANEGEFSYVRATLGAGRETTISMGALRFSFSGPVAAIQVFDADTGHKITERASYAAGFNAPLQLPPGRYRVYVQVSENSSGLALDPVEVRPGQTTEVRL